MAKVDQYSEGGVPRRQPPRSSRTNGDGLARTARAPREKPGVKKEQILEVAINHFGQYGYEDSKWADVADAVGIGPTALYHYFVSKQHCLYDIMAAGIMDFKNRFDAVVSSTSDWSDALVKLLVSNFDLTDQEVLRVRILVAEQGLMGPHREIPREETARATARSLMRDLEFTWGAFLARGMQQGLIPEQEPRILTRALLGLHNSVWHWYRPGGPLSLAEVGEFYVRAQLRVMGSTVQIPQELLDTLR
jgi:TetR/AcrR family transcriptional regulator, cholesterol catabolism regulator